MTPKELSKNRLAKSKLMKIPNNEGKFSNKENENPQFINIKKKTYKIHDRKIKDDNLPNPFGIPDHMRLFSKGIGQRKVKPDPFIMSEPHTICDVDNTFYKVIEGRPLRQSTDVKVYMRNIRDITLFKANATYLKDQILQFESSYTFEMEQLTETNNLYEKTKNNFVKFAKQSYEEAKEIQMTAEVNALKVVKITEQLEALSFHYVKLKNQLSSIVFSFETLSRYGKFLNSLSPEWWRAEFDFLNDKRSCILPSPNKMQSNIVATSTASLDEYKISITKFTEIVPHLYFKKPRHLISVFEDMSRQCLNYMKIEVFASSIVNSVQKSRDFLKLAAKMEIDEMQDNIEIYENNVKFLEKKEMDYKAVFEKLLFSEFQTLYASPETTKLFTCVQYVNTRLFGGSEDPKDSVKLLMRGIEMQYTELTSDLDTLDVEVVKTATNQMFADDIKMMKRAHLAQRTLKECDILRNALYTSFEPPRQRKIVKETAKDSEKENTK